MESSWGTGRRFVFPAVFISIVLLLLLAPARGQTGETYNENPGSTQVPPISDPSAVRNQSIDCLTSGGCGTWGEANGTGGTGGSSGDNGGSSGSGGNGGGGVGSGGSDGGSGGSGGSSGGSVGSGGSGGGSGSGGSGSGGGSGGEGNGNGTGSGGSDNGGSKGDGSGGSGGGGSGSGGSGSGSGGSGSGSGGSGSGSGGSGSGGSGESGSGGNGGGSDGGSGGGSDGGSGGGSDGGNGGGSDGGNGGGSDDGGSGGNGNGGDENGGSGGSGTVVGPVNGGNGAGSGNVDTGGGSTIGPGSFIETTGKLIECFQGFAYQTRLDQYKWVSEIGERFYLKPCRRYCVKIVFNGQDLAGWNNTNNFYVSTCRDSKMPYECGQTVRATEFINTYNMAVKRTVIPKYIYQAYYDYARSNDPVDGKVKCCDSRYCNGAGRLVGSRSALLGVLLAVLTAFLLL